MNMDEQAAKEYFALLQVKIEEKSSYLNEAFFVPLIAGCGYLAFVSISGAILGASIGWGICACLIRLKDIKREIYIVEFRRHLHEHTSHAEAGIAQGKIQSSVNKFSARGWFR